MNQLIKIFALLSLSFNASAFVGLCDISHLVTPWEKIVSIKKTVLSKSAEEDDIPVGVSISFLKSFEGYEFKEVYFVVDNYENRWGSRLIIPLAINSENGEIRSYVKIPTKELGKHGLLVVWHNDRLTCDADKYFPIDA